MKRNPLEYVLPPDEFIDNLKWARPAKQMKEVVKAIHVSALENQIEDIKKGTVRA